MSKKITDTLIEIISKSLNIKKNKINEKTNLQNLEEWDSLGVLSVMTALDKKYKGLIKISSFDKVITVSDIKRLLK
ncbi:acyl carrier protein [Candidatus Pelagibacter sp.]|jgi:acyl carrier protein|nr:acyl carrier protein [Candidatus Pelagibacter sp.]|tara:strand:+ start:177 stop:404 length:228 start_codon:yes stop_codon:yes gene_type:complete